MLHNDITIVQYCTYNYTSMKSTKFQLFLTEPNGNFANPEIIITSEFESTFSIQNAADISQRKDNIAKNITFPGTKNNNRIFNNIYSLNHSSDNSLAEVLFFNYSPNKGVRAILYENNCPIFAGTLKINSIKPDANGAFTYTGVLTGNMINLFGKIGDTLLSDLTYFDAEQTYSTANILASWAFESTDKFLYPMIDFGAGVVPRRDKFDVRNIRPAIYLRHYLKAIFAQFGYRYASAFIDSDIFNRIFIPFGESGFGQTVYGDALTVLSGVFSTVFATWSTAPGQVRFDFASLKLGILPINNFIDVLRGSSILMHTDTSSALRDITRPGDVLIFKKFVTTGVKITVTWTASRDSTGNCMFRLGLYEIVGNVLHFESPIDFIDLDFNTNPLGGTHTFTLPYASYNEGFKFGVFCPVTNGYNVHFNQTSVNVVVGDPDPARGSFFGYELGDTYNLKDAIPRNQRATDFLKAILTTFNMYIIENPADEKELIIEPYNTFYEQSLEPKDYALNWTNKVDQKTLDMKINTGLPKSYAFKFKSDSDFYNTLYKNTYNETYGDLIVQNKNGSADAKTIDVIFSPTVIVKESGDDKTLPSIFSGEITAKKSFKSNLRLLFNNGVKNCRDFNLSSFADGVYTNRSAKIDEYQASHTVLNLGGIDLFNLLFGVPKAVYYDIDGSIFDVATIFSEVYAAQLTELNDDDIYTLELDCHLTERDISGLDLRTPIYISTVQGDSYFKIMSVTYYSSREVSKVKFQKIIL